MRSSWRCFCQTLPRAVYHGSSVDNCVGGVFSSMPAWQRGESKILQVNSLQFCIPRHPIVLRGWMTSALSPIIQPLPRILCPVSTLLLNRLISRTTDLSCKLKLKVFSMSVASVPHNYSIWRDFQLEKDSREIFNEEKMFNVYRHCDFGLKQNKVAGGPMKRCFLYEGASGPPADTGGAEEDDAPFHVHVTGDCQIFVWLLIAKVWFDISTKLLKTFKRIICGLQNKLTQVRLVVSLCSSRGKPESMQLERAAALLWSLSLALHPATVSHCSVTEKRPVKPPYGINSFWLLEYDLNLSVSTESLCPSVSVGIWIDWWNESFALLRKLAFNVGSVHPTVVLERGIRSASWFRLPLKWSWGSGIIAVMV